MTQHGFWRRRGLRWIETAQNNHFFSFFNFFVSVRVVSHSNQNWSHAGLITGKSIDPQLINENLLIGYLWLFDELWCLWLRGNYLCKFTNSWKDKLKEINYNILSQRVFGLILIVSPNFEHCFIWNLPCSLLPLPCRSLLISLHSLLSFHPTTRFCITAPSYPLSYVATHVTTLHLKTSLVSSAKM